MKSPLVVPDASVILKWALASEDEEDRDRALALRDAWLAGECRVLVPSLWVYEVGNVLGRKEPRLAPALLSALIALRLDEIQAADVAETAFGLMATAHVTFYDAVYHAVAIDLGGTLVTADASHLRRTSRTGRAVLLRSWKL